MNSLDKMEEIDRLARLCEAKDAESAELRNEVEVVQKDVVIYSNRLSEAQAQVAMQAKALELALEHGVYPQGTGIIHQIREALSATSETVAAFRAKETEPLRMEVAMLVAHIKRSACRCKCSVHGYGCSTYESTCQLEIQCERCRILSNTQATALAYEREVENRGAVKALEDYKADNGRGFSLWLSREEWGGIIDGLGLEIERSGGRKNANSESTSDVRMTMCERIIAAINNASELRAANKGEVK